MSTPTGLIAPPGKPPDEDPFRYGWRYVRRTRADGTETFVQVPLTLEDVFHPQEEDFIVQRRFHIEDFLYLGTVFKTQVAHNPEALVLMDCRVAWDAPGVIPNGPDVVVFDGVRDAQNRDWGTFDVAAEDAQPLLAVEITSEDTRKNDFGNKKDEYFLAGVSFYAIVDVEERRSGRVLHLHGYRRTPAGYEELPLDERGWLWLDPLGIWLGTKENRVACYDAAGQELGDYERVAKAWQAETEARQAAEALAAEEAQARQAAEGRVTKEARARRAAERRVAKEAQARQAAERRVAKEARAHRAAERRVTKEAQARQAAEGRVAEEAQARQAAEARLQELEAELKRLRNKS